MATISQMIFSNAFSWMKTFEIQIIFLWNVFLKVYNWQYVIIGSDNGLASNKQQAIVWTNDGLVYWRTYLCHSASMS